MKASVHNERLIVDITPDEVRTLYFDRQIIGDRYGSLYTSGLIPAGFTAEGKVSTDPLEAIDEDFSGQFTRKAGRLSWGIPRLVARLDQGDGLGLLKHKSKSVIM